MKIKKLVFCAGLISTSIISLLYVNRLEYEKYVNSHIQTNNHNANIIAHRGFSSLELENSFKSVNLAFECNCCDGVEVDVRLSKDNEVVLAHDESVFGIGKIENKTLDELKEKKRKNNPVNDVSQVKTIFSKDAKLVIDRSKEISNSKEHICTLNEIIDSENKNKILLVDLKFSNDNVETLYNKINEIFNDYNGKLDITFQASDYKKLVEMKNLYPNYKYQLIIKKEKDLKYLDSDFDYYCIRKNLITKNLVKDLINNNKKISVWTINSYHDYKELSKEIGTYISDIYIITDYPDEMCYLVNKTIDNSNKKFALTFKK